MTDEHDDWNAAIRAAAGRTLPAEDEQPDEEQPRRTGSANAGVRPLPQEPADMNEAIRRAASRSRYGVDGTQSRPIPR